MKKILYFITIALVFVVGCSKPQPQPKFKPTVASLQEYETPKWFNDAKFGIWVCWNAYTVPAVGDWYARNMYIEGHPHYKYHLENFGHPSEFGYKDIIQKWDGEEFNAEELVDLFVEVGAKYIVGMANHHDNFDLWNSKHHSWNSLNYGPKRDIMGEFQKAVRKYENQGIRWGVTSHVERASCWFQTNKGTDENGKYAGIPYDGNNKKYEELYLPPDPNGDVKPTQPSNAPDYWKKNWLARCKDLFDNYDPDFFYVDGGVPFPGDDKGETGLEMISYLYNQSMDRHNGENQSVMCIKDWYKKAPKGEWGYYWDGIATLNLERARLPQIRKKPWQTDTSIGDWTYVKNGKYRSTKEIIHELIDIVSKNGNMLLNVSPMANGKLDNKAFGLLNEIGAWMKINGESIYGTKPWLTSGVGDYRIVKKGNDLLYLSILNVPESNKISIPYIAPQNGKSLEITSISILGNEHKKVKWKSDGNGLHIQLPEKIEFKHALVIKIKAEHFENYDETPILKLFDRKEELTQWWKNQTITKTNSGYTTVTCDAKNNSWAIKTDNSLVEIKDGNEIDLGIKAQDVGANASGIVYVDLNGSVFIHTNHHLQWVDFPTGIKRITHKSKDGKIWLKLPGLKAKRCDITQTGTVWVTDQNGIINYYDDLLWKPLDKKAEDIACGGDWISPVAAISNGQLERFDGTHWTNLGGYDLKALDISIENEVLVTLNKKGNVTLFDKMGSIEIDKNEAYMDVSCGSKKGTPMVLIGIK
ncbi:Alpha-L-fucosidase [Lutibacter oricola]|uniref:alpha-L-fucosidase n=1 Tax=Lutibacter oricola TaxID=762486 RepID=A0A1H2S7U6_9FLAO|nr:alpha-L-fucosidase [Lutibacter oricola]SDW27772.1 Alpha-L-fucosidase [Lutibacter oricola]